MADKKRILIVDDEENHRFMVGLHLKENYDILEAQNGLEALNILDDEHVDLILLDVKMDVMDGLTFLSHLRKKNLNIPVIVISAFNNVRTAVESMKLGALDYITKPVDIEILKNQIENLLESEDKNEMELVEDYVYEGVYSKEGLGKIIDVLKLVAPTDATVLIMGESGTGKELVARSIHLNSPRKNEPFLAVNCAALNENLIESELFGHEKGAFTGAESRKLGKFELANGGTLFLDEVGELPISTQAKLLRVLQEGTFERVGGTKTIKTDVRIIAATNRDLEKMVQEGKFREDLYYRLNVFPVKLPPLRERKNEIPLLLDFFIKKYSQKFQKIIKGYEDGFLEKLMRYDFPGNIRELENIVERSIILARSERLTSDLLPPLKYSNGFDSGVKNIKEHEIEAIKNALKETGGNKTKAAELLGISRKTLHNKLKEYNIEV
ncbi:two-component system, NtrC family, transcriptional regulator [Deferribacter desulfuricans SSM1]|uniref:Two-component system, NtrC family, transcriptional regulator n=1 Tax=Deferribacter desulfuricans (strain DSM 14783 / JCM 11476 / NBRC 101012 / SSM1) TaxID=639282 RepID=D3PA19_DEFDS|nr:sigma-54 dependent transcriptional regulator [Deferribacter desulfuricans]BAI81559.1 two-component system, NtrC family, transcriptional regulator [Deferribacter desulfuricans SSM1]